MMPDNVSSMPVADVYRMFGELQTGMTKIEVHLERMDVEHKANGEKLGDHEARMRVIEATSPGQFAGQIQALEGRLGQLERFRYMLAGVIALLAIACSGLGTWIVSSLVHH